MKLIHRRAKKWCRVFKRVYFKKGKNIISEDKSLFFKRCGIHSTIALHRSEFKLIKRNAKRLTHFNIQWTGHKPGRKYLITKIEKFGYFNGIVFKPPILSYNNFILAKRLSVQNQNKYASLSDNVFRYSLSNIKDISSLKKAIKRRYKKSLAHISDSKKLSLGVAITKLKIIKRF